MILGWTLTILFFLVSIIILIGKGDFLILEFDTIIKKNVKKYDQNKLRYVVGSGGGIISIILGIYFYFDELPNLIAWIYPLGLWAVMLITGVLTHTVCRKKH